MGDFRKINSIEALSLEGRRLFLRLDLNVPLGEVDPETGLRKIENKNRIEEALPTIRYAIEKGAKVIIASHLGQPKGIDKRLSLEPVASALAEMLETEITFANDCVGEGIELMTKNLQRGKVMLLENLRFHAGEEKNDPEFCTKLLRLAEFYVNDAFGTAHRKHASTYGLPSMNPQKAMGFLIAKELKYLSPLLDSPASPFICILGGAKVSDKIKTIEFLAQKTQGIIIGGAMAYAFILAEGEKVPHGAKMPTPTDIEAAKAILNLAKKQNLTLLLPVDFIESFDIGPRTIDLFADFCKKAKTLFWNGPMGWFEKPEYSFGTFELARRIGALSAVKVVGGGDTVSAIQQAGLQSQFDHLSTGGGAVLEYLEGHGLPGIEVLKQSLRQIS